MKSHNLALMLVLATTTLAPQCAGYEDTAPVVTEESGAFPHPVVVIPRVAYEGGRMMGTTPTPTATTSTTARTEKGDSAFLRRGWRQLTPSRGATYRNLVGRLTNKLHTHRDLITANEQGRRKRGLPPIHRSAPLGLNHDDWLLVENLGPAIQASSDLLPMAPKGALRTLRRLLKAAQEEPKKRLGTLFSKEAASRLHSVMVHIQKRLIETEPSKLRKLSLEEAIELVEDIIKNPSRAQAIQRGQRRAAK